MHLKRFAVVLSCLLAAAGCAKKASAPKPLTPEAFISPREAASDNDKPPAGESGARPNVRIPAGNGKTSTSGDVPRPPVADVVDQAIKPVGPVATNGATTPTTSATTLPAIGRSAGQYVTLGGVVAEVNGTPIYANKVLALLDEPLRTKAKQLDRAAFSRFAKENVARQIMELIRNELEYAAAQRSLDLDDRRMAEMGTMVYRQQLITRAGGSIEMAKRASLNDPILPMDFEERIAEQSRLELVKIYYNKKVYPKIQVSGVDIREYYDKNVGKEFTQNEQVKFRLLKVDIAKTGTKDAAITKINDKYKRAKAGEDFKEMVLKENDEKMFAREDMGDVAPRSFAIAKVRDALEKLQPGQISDIIEDRGGFYLVQVVERKEGRVRPFEEQKVQDEIRFKLRSEQFRVLREQKQQELMKGAIIRADEQMAQIALDMAMQKYPQYAAAK